MKQSKTVYLSERTSLLFLMNSILVLEASAQGPGDANTGITNATTSVTSYFATGVNLMYAIGAVLGLVGAIKVYQKWSHGDQDTSKVAASWFGSCIFLVVVATILKAFFLG